MTDLSSLGADSGCVWTRAAALELITKGRVRGLLRDGSWQTVYPGIYADAGNPLTPEQLAWAVVLACGGRGAVAAGRTAARLWGLPLIDDHDPATQSFQSWCDDAIVEPGGAAPAVLTRRGVRGARVLRGRRRALNPAEVVRRPSGLALTSVEGTLFGLAGLLTQEALVCAVDDALHRKLVTPAQLAAGVSARVWMPGAPAYRRAVALADGRSESPAETLTRLLLLPVLPALEPQVQVYYGNGRPLARLDLGDRTVRLAVEADGRRGHAGEQMVAKDRRRDRILAERGWWTERVTWWDLRRDAAATRRRICARHGVLAARRSS